MLAERTVTQRANAERTNAERQEALPKKEISDEILEMKLYDFFDQGFNENFSKINMTSIQALKLTKFVNDLITTAIVNDKKTQVTPQCTVAHTGVS